MKKIITAHIQGGIGNQLFIIATCLSFAKDNNFECIFLKTNCSPSYDCNRATYWNIFPNIKTVKEISILKIYSEPFHHYRKIPIFDTDIKLFGYFQSPKYFNNNKNYILKCFEPNNETKNYVDVLYKNIINKYDNSDTISIHVRRGDYLEFKNVFVELDINYYIKAASYFNIDSLFIIFSDDIKWCKNMFTNKYFKNIYFVENNEDYIELLLMSKCSNNIIANSTFSWWAAYLNQNKDKKVVAPKKFFNNDNSIKDFYPQNWILI